MACAAQRRSELGIELASSTMTVRTMLGWALLLATEGCFSWSSSSGGDGGAPTCAQSGSFTARVYESTVFCDAGNPPPNLPITVNYGSDGSGTVNGESCAAYCYTDAGLGTCASFGMPPAPPARNCAVVLRCMGTIQQVDFGAPMQGQPASQVLVTLAGDAGPFCNQYSN